MAQYASRAPLSRSSSISCMHCQPAFLFGRQFYTITSSVQSPMYTQFKKASPSIFMYKPSKQVEKNKNHQRCLATNNTDEEGDDETDFDDEFDEEDFEDQDGDIEISAGGLDWGEKCLSIAQNLVSTRQDLALYSFRVIPQNKRIDVRIDKLSDQFGSPSLDEVIEFTRSFNAAMEESFGEEEAGKIEIEVSSPGAERQVVVPQDLLRFSQQPMKVLYTQQKESEEKKEEQQPSIHEEKILEFIDIDSANTMTRWRLANVKANRSGKGRPLNKKQREGVFEISVDSIIKVNLHVDM